MLSQSVDTPPSGSSVTTWNYLPVTGLLASKRDAATKGADYEYTPAGRLWKRTWARGGTTIYTYTAGRLTKTDYPVAPVGTPIDTLDVTYTYNRLPSPASLPKSTSLRSNTPTTPTSRLILRSSAMI